MSSRILVFNLLMLGLISSQPAQAESKIDFSGSLISGTCSLAPGDANIEVALGTLDSKNLYANSASADVPFALHLTDCKRDIADQIAITFNGMADSDLPNLLAISPASTAKGIAIGLKTDSGQPLTINQVSPAMAIIDGNNNLNFKAFAQVTPTALADKGIREGQFNAVATFALSYP